jgi:uncharacterized membrane-anchored protein YhcB (DUF1043 family)
MINWIQKNLVAAIIGAVLLVFAFGIANDIVRYNNQATILENQFNAEQESVTIQYDNLWKTISQKAEISDKYKNDFKDIYTEIVSSRYQDDNLLFKFITESNPNYDVSLLKDLSRYVEAGRLGFTNSQQKLIDLKREHDNMRTTFPSSLYLGNRKELDLNLVTSSRTEEVRSTGKDDDVDLFK